MKENTSALFSSYIIDGIKCDSIPYDLLSECMPRNEEVPYSGPGAEYKDIIDETVDFPPAGMNYSADRIHEYISMLITGKKDIPYFRLRYPDTFTKQKIAGCILRTIWKKGNFRLDDLHLDIRWEWDSLPLGNMASFYFSVKSASEYIYDLGLKLDGFGFDGNRDCCGMSVSANLSRSDTPADMKEDSTFIEMPFESSNPWITDEASCSSVMKDSPGSWLIYIPFDTCQFRLGGSAFGDCLGQDDGTALQLMDPDYFIDCFEVVRELIEDGIVMAGCGIGCGGLAVAAEKFRNGMGMGLDLGGIMSAYGETDIIRILFSEIPGVLIQISDNDYDYVDSQFILQDIAYYPIGHPTPDGNGMRFAPASGCSLAGILESLIRGQDL